MKDSLSVWYLTSVKGKELIIWSWQHKAQSLGCRTQWALTLIHREKNETEEVELSSVLGLGGLHLAVAICSQWAELASSSALCFACWFAHGQVEATLSYKASKRCRSKFICKVMESADMAKPSTTWPLSWKEWLIEKFTENLASEFCKEINLKQGRLALPTSQNYCNKEPCLPFKNRTEPLT